MSERMTEAILVELQREATTMGPQDLALEVSALVTEVRRLRGLILDVATIRPGDHPPPHDDPGVRCPFYDDFMCSWCKSGDGHVNGCPWPAMEAEAQAIADEMRTGTNPAPGSRNSRKLKEAGGSG